MKLDFRAGTREVGVQREQGKCQSHVNVWQVKNVNFRMLE